jgi:hypothetical protein
VRHVLQPDTIEHGHEQPWLQQQELIVPREGSSLPLYLRGGVRRCDVERSGLGFEYHPPPIEHCAHRREHVVENRARWQWPPARAAQRVDRSGCAQHGIDVALPRTQPLLVAPIRADTVSHGRVADTRFTIQDQLSRDRTHGVVRKRRDQAANGIRRKQLARVGEHDDIVSRRAHAGVEGLRFPVPFHLNELEGNARAAQAVGCCSSRLRSRIRRSVGDQYDLQPVGGVLQGGKVLEARRHANGFIPRRYHDGYRWTVAVRAK